MKEKKHGKPEGAGSFADKLGAVLGQQPPRQERRETISSLDKTRFPAPVSDPRRAGRAPYNFVPLAESARWLNPEEKPPDHDRYHPELLSGEIQLDWTGLTDFYIRGMHAWKDFLAHDKKDRPEPALPFQANDRLILPGSSQRGLIRSVIEILAGSPLDPVNDSQLFFRTVAASDSPRDSSFEPQAVAYKRRMAPVLGAAPENVQAGFLYAGRDGWFIHPAQSKNGRQYYKVRDHRAWEKPVKIWFRATSDSDASISSAGAPEAEEGWLLRSGPFPKKQHQWIVRLEDSGPGKVAIPDADVLAYKEGGISRAIEEKHFEFSDRSKGVPCFFVKWKDAAGRDHVSFGHTRFFRLPYVHTVRLTIPPTCRREETETRWDLAEAIFGRAGVSGNKREGMRGRVFFEDAHFISGPDPAFDTRVRYLILGQPKPTTFQHYVVQLGPRVEDSIHWDGNYLGRGEAVVRGHKAYWHRPGAAVPFQTDPGKVVSSLHPARKGCRFTSRIRFENLRPWEMGALLTALDLPEGCAHKLGMAKAHGFGSFRISISRILTVDRGSRYRSLLENVSASGAARLTSGARVVSTHETAQWKTAFAYWIASEHLSIDQFWRDPRLAEYKALLTFSGLPEDWSDRTRYLEFGRLLQQGRTTQLNEYTQPSKRRPLPPATQTLSDRRLPSNPRPEFVQARED